MNVKIIIYLLTIPMSIWALDSLNINHIFKKNRYYSSRLFIFMLSASLSYLFVNFLFDLFENAKLISF